MFCPRCGAENRREQKFCRRCGLSLPGVRLALEGRLLPGVETLKKDFDRLAGGIFTLVIFALIALVSFFFDSSRNWSVFANLLLGLLIAGPIVYLGLKRVDRAIKLVDPGEAGWRPAIEPAGEEAKAGKDALPDSAPDTDPLETPAPVPPLSAPASITEETTLHLEHPFEHPSLDRR